METRRMTMAQALVGFLKNQYVERDGREHRFFHGAWGIFGHGCIAGIGQALQQNPDFRYYQSQERAGGRAHRDGVREDEEPSGHVRLHLLDRTGRDEHDHRRGHRDRSIAFRCCCCPATSSRAATWRRCCSNWSPSTGQDISVNDAFKPVSRYWDRINRPDQLILARWWRRCAC